MTGPAAGARPPIGLLLGGDVMLGRGVDQALPGAGDPALPARWRGVGSARTFVELAERRSGLLPERRHAAYVWGELLAEFRAPDIDLRLVNLETAVTTSDEPWPRKWMHYRMHPANTATLVAVGIDCCSLANNHVLDWGQRGLEETLAALRGAGIRTAGAGRDRAAAEAPAVLEAPGKGRVAVFSFATLSSGVPVGWAARRQRPGVNVILQSSCFVTRIANLVRPIRKDAAVVVASIHWGPNWNWSVPGYMRRFAHRLIDEAGVDVIHGHSSHHVKGIEVYRDRLILYGAGDLINDYEGLSLRRSAGRRELERHRRVPAGSGRALPRAPRRGHGRVARPGADPHADPPAAAPAGRTRRRRVAAGDARPGATRSARPRRHGGQRCPAARLKDPRGRGAVGVAARSGDPGGIRTRGLNLERVASWARLDDGVSRGSIPDARAAPTAESIPAPRRRARGGR